MQILRGAPIAKAVMNICAELMQTQRVRPGLTVVQIGSDPASQVYVQHKKKAAEELGILFHHQHFSEQVSSSEVMDCLEKYNHDPQIHGIIVQLPLPEEHCAREGHCARDYLDVIAPCKDVDGLGKKSHFLPCTPLGCWTLLKAYHIPLEGMHAVVVGRSDLVGKPLAQCLLQENATVTLTHSYTRDLKHFTRSADLLCVCAGKPGLICQEDIQPCAVILDIGIHRTAQGLRGDVDPQVICRAKTPVPGGIGPMTVSLLMWNVVQSALQFEGKKSLSYLQFFERVRAGVSIID